MATNQMPNPGGPRPGDRAKVIRGTFTGMVGNVISIAEAEMLARPSGGQRPHYKPYPDTVWVALTVYGRNVPVRLETSQVEVIPAG